MPLKSEDYLCFYTRDVSILLGVEKPTLCLQLYTCVYICKQGIAFDLSRVQGIGIFDSGPYVVFMTRFRFLQRNSNRLLSANIIKEICLKYIYFKAVEML